MKHKKEENFSEWFQELIKETELVDDRYNIKGFIVYREWCAKTLKKMFYVYETYLNETEHEPLFMPTLIPEENFYKEKEHVEGFTPEVFWVTSHGDNEEFEKKLALRPTSETAFYQMYSLWIRSYKDLPFKRYQSGPVFRYETKATRPFFRGREFFWIETHCAFANEEDARNQVKQDMETTEEMLHKRFGMPFIFFKRPAWDKFAGAVDTFAADALMPSGKLLQLPSTHYLGTNFSKPFNVTFKNKEGEEEYAHITCYGPSITRIYGGMIALHSDNKGLRMPFELAPLQIVIVPILFAKDNELVLKESKKIYNNLKKYYDVKIDLDKEKKTGEKFYFWELKGVPIRIEIGPRDLKEKKVTVFRRDLNEKDTIPLDKLENKIKEIAETFTENLRKQADAMFKDNIKEVKDLKELEKAIKEGKIAKAEFCSVELDGEKCADTVKEKTGAEVRGTKLNEKEKPKGKCIVCGKKANAIVYIGKSY